MLNFKHLALVFRLHAHSRRISIRSVPELAPLLELQLLRGHILGHGLEVGVNQRVGFPFSALACIATVPEACGLEHLPDGRVTPVVWPALRPYLNIEVVVASLKYGGHGPPLVPVQAHHILFQLLKCIIEGHLIVGCLALAETDYALAVANEDKHASLVHSI